MATLDASVRLVSLQFSFSNPEAIPAGVKQRAQETVEERVERKSRTSGTMIMEPTENCSLVEFIGELEATGYELVDAFCKERLDAKDPRGRRTYHMVRFVFVHRAFVNSSEEFGKVRDAIRADLQEMCQTAFWRVRMFLNPFYQNNEETEGQHALSINLEARQPRFLPNGQPVMVWQKDENGRRVGNSPLPLQPNHHLRLVNNAVQLV